MSPSFSVTPSKKAGSGGSSPSPQATPKGKTSRLPEAPPLSSSPSSSSTTSTETATPGGDLSPANELGLALGQQPRAKSPLRALFTPKRALASLPGPSTSSSSNPVAPSIEHTLSHDAGIAAVQASTVAQHEHHENHKHKSLPTDDELEGNASLATSRATLAVPARDTWRDGGVNDDEMPSTFRERSRSPSRVKLGVVDDSDNNKDEANDGHHLAASWWGAGEKKKKGVKKMGTPEEQAAVDETRKKVAKAVLSVLGTSAEVAHELLALAVEFSEFVPVPGLAVAAQTLLNIWDAAQEVDMNTNGCLRLTERCADSLYTIRDEVARAGDTIGDSLREPIAKLEESFTFVLTFVSHQYKRPWLKRYLRRDEIPREIADCDARLRDALALFGISIQIRILEQVRNSEIMREKETRVLALEALKHAGGHRRSITGEENFTEVFSPEPHHAFPPAYYPPTPGTETDNALGLFDEPLISPLDLPSSSIHDSDDTPDALKTKAAIEKEMEAQTRARVAAELAGMQNAQNAADAVRDSSALRALLRNALDRGSDAAILEVLQTAREEMPDAIKALQRALEGLVERESISGDNLSNSATLSGAGDPTWPGSAGTGQFNLPSSATTATGRKPTLPHQEVLAVGVDGTVVQRTETLVSSITSSTESSSLTGSFHRHRHAPGRRDTLDFEFIEMGIDCMRRLSRGSETTVPNWTITKYEVDRQDKVGYGFFSDVYKGRWQNKTVAIKVLAPSTPRNLFVREMGIWKTLNHPNVLRLYGASSACGPSPWFFVSPYLQHGTLVDYLRYVELHIQPRGLGVGVGANDLAGTITPRANSPAVRASTLPVSPMYITGKSPKQGGATRHPLLGPTPAYLSPASARKALPGFSPNVLSSELFDPIDREWDLFRFMHEVAKGMSYLHSMGVLHGDLKASNVLVGDKYRCVITDFGQSEMKSEAFRTTGIPPSRGTLRWQAPEFMAGKAELSQPVDIYAFSITCVEILTMGRLPWLNQDDTAVRHFVLHDDTRPPTPRFSRFNIPSLQNLLRKCWDKQPEKRPPFKSIAEELKRIRKSVGESPDTSPFFLPQEVELPPAASPSPDMRPKDLPAFLAGADAPTLPADVLEGALMSDRIGASIRREQQVPHRESTVSSGIAFPEPVIYTPATSRKSSVHLVERVGPDPVKQPVDDGYESPLPLDGIPPLAKNERRYRLLLTHNFHPSLTLPLWDPSPVEVGAVGYLLKPEGRFITLFNAMRPRDEALHPKIRTLPTIEGYGPVVLGEQQLPKRTVTQRALDAIIGSITFRNTTSETIARRYPFPLKAGHKAAYLYTEMTDYRYVESLDAPKLWFRNNSDLIMQIYAAEHHITREELFLIIGTLNTPAWALMVSHRHPEGHAHFNVYSAPKAGRPWGTFTTDTEIERGLGPLYEGEEMNEPPRVNASKVSKHGLAAWDSVLLARLRFKPDALDPTSK